MSTNLETELTEAALNIRKALTDLGLCYITKDGARVEISYKSLELVGDEYGLIEVDTQRLPPRVRIDQLVHKQVLHHLTAVTGKKVARLNTTGLTYCVLLKSAPKGRLPRRVDLPLDERPTGEYVLGFGQSREGPVWRELSQLTHLIVAGSSDSGKSAFLRSLVYQALRQPAPVELYLADLEGLTFAWVEGSPSLKLPIAQDVKTATYLTWTLLAEIERRARLYAATGRFPESLAEYHEKAEGRPFAALRDASQRMKEEDGDGHPSSLIPHPSRLPWIVAIFDEFTALAEAAGKRSALMDNVAQLAQRSRKFGMTLVLAGQDFKADLLNTRITNQLRTRVQFRCATRAQSEVVLGQSGAEHLSAPGRALVRLDGRILEVQTYWLDKARLVESAPLTPHSTPAAPVTFSDEERALARYAIEHLDGEFVVNRLFEAFRDQIPQPRLRELVEQGRSLPPAD
jgi:hypothetical protein